MDTLYETRFSIKGLFCRYEWQKIYYNSFAALKLFILSQEDTYRVIQESAFYILYYAKKEGDIIFIEKEI